MRFVKTNSMMMGMMMYMCSMCMFRRAVKCSVDFQTA